MVRAVLALLAVAPGCAVSLPPVPMQEFRSGDLETVRAFYEEQAYTGDENSTALFLNGLAQVELLLGRTEEAWRHFLTAGRVMGNWATSGSETFAAIFGSESSKTWKGDPYEKAMNAYYTGLLFSWRHEPDNARASFKKGILADAESNDEKYRADFALLFWLAGRMSVAMGLSSDAEEFFREAREAHRFAVEHGARGDINNPVLRDPAAGNLVCVVDVGIGPEKFAAGSYGELARFRPRGDAAAYAEIVLDGQSLGRTSIMTDVFYQATTRGGTEMEGIREGKAVLKTVSTVSGIVLINEALKDRSDKGRRDKLIVGGGLLLLSLLTSASADVRHWEILPDTVQVLTADVPKGVHDLQVVFRDRRGAVVPNLTQSWTVEVPDVGDNIYYFRSLPGLDQLQPTP